MIRAAIPLLALLLAACGADGEPQPVRGGAGSGVTISGTATIGVGGRF